MVRLALSAYLPMIPVTVRASSLPTYADCARRWSARALWDRLKDMGYELNFTPNGIGAVVGTATHSGAAYILTEKMNTGELGNPTEAVERGLQDVDDTVKEGVAWDDTTTNVDTAHTQVRRMIAVYRRDVAPALKPIAVENRLTNRFSDRIILSGQADEMEHDEAGDLKTGAARSAYTGQYGAYCLLARSHDGRVDRFSEFFVKRCRPSKEQEPPVRTVLEPEPLEQHTQAILKKIERDLEDFDFTGDPNAFLPNPSSMLCGPKYCPAHGTPYCTAHKKE